MANSILTAAMPDILDRRISAHISTKNVLYLTKRLLTSTTEEVKRIKPPVTATMYQLAAISGKQA
jgi:hypothetical protein